MAQHPAPELGAPTITGVDPSVDDDAAVPLGNAGPDCFWIPVGATLPTPRIAEVHSLDQQPKPPRQAR